MKISLDVKFSNIHFVYNYNHSNFSLLCNYKNLKQIYIFGFWIYVLFLSISTSTPKLKTRLITKI